MIRCGDEIERRSRQSHIKAGRMFQRIARREAVNVGWGGAHIKNISVKAIFRVNMQITKIDIFIGVIPVRSFRAFGCGDCFRHSIGRLKGGVSTSRQYQAGGGP